MDVTQLTKLADLDFTNLIQSENNVKYKIVIPFLQSFGHQHLDMEHAAQGSRIDINIGNKIIVETKALNQHLNRHIQQLSDYCGREWPVLAILTNGRKFQIFSPQWRRQATFREKIIYKFDIKELTNEKLLYRLEKILGLSNYQNNEFFNHISQREKELLEIGRKIDDLKQDQTGSISSLRIEINDLKKNLEELNNQILQKEREVAEIESKEVPEIESLISEFFVPKFVATPDLRLPRIVEPRDPVTVNRRRTFPNGCTVDGVHYQNGARAIDGLLSSGKIEEMDLPRTSYNAHLWLMQNHSRFSFRYERDEA